MPEVRNQAPESEKDTQPTPNSRYPIVKRPLEPSKLLAPVLTFVLFGALSIKNFFGELDSWNSKFYNAITGEVIRIGDFFFVVMWAILSIICILALLFLWSIRHVNCYQLNCPACGQPLFFPTESKTHDCPTCTKRLVLVDGIVQAADDLINPQQ